MKRAISLFVVVTSAFVILVAEHGFAQDKTPVKVKSSVVVTGVVVVHVLKDGKPLELQCNEGATTCKALPSGSFPRTTECTIANTWRCIEAIKTNQKTRRLATTVWLRIDRGAVIAE